METGWAYHSSFVTAAPLGLDALPDTPDAALPVPEHGSFATSPTVETRNAP
jgi:hypothetical protein